MNDRAARREHNRDNARVDSLLMLFVNGSEHVFVSQAFTNPRQRFEELSTANKCDVFVLEMRQHNTAAFWDQVRRAVLDGRIELSQDIHCMWDEPLVTAVRFVDQ